MHHIELKIVQVATTTLNIDEMDLKKAGLTLEELENACSSKDAMNEAIQSGKLSSIIPEIVEPNRTISMHIISKEFDDDMIIVGGH